MLPNFIIAGAARSGTTSLYRYCSEHPDVFMSEVKETNFFSSNPFEFTRESYEKLFESAGSAVAVGEASPSYLYEESAPGAIRDAVPHCRIVIILRNPVDRLISDFFYSQSWGANLDLDLTQFVDACLANVGAGRQGFVPALMVRKGFYAEQLRRYRAHFPANQLFIRLYDDLQEAPEKLVADLYAFIGVDPSYQPGLGRVHNANSEPVIPFFSRMVRRARRLEKLLVNPLVPSTRKGRITRLLLDLNRRGRTRESIRQSVQPDDRARLLDLYRTSMLELELMLRRDLSTWHSPHSGDHDARQALSGNGMGRDDLKAGR